MPLIEKNQIYKDKKKLLFQLREEHEAVMNQLGFTLEAVKEKRLERKADTLQERIGELEEELRRLEAGGSSLSGRSRSARGEQSIPTIDFTATANKKSLLIVTAIVIAAVLLVVIPLLGDSGLGSTATPANTPSALATPFSTDSNGNALVSATIREKETGYLFDGELFITVKSVNMREHQVTGVIGSRGYPNQRFEDVEVGDVTAYEGDRRYEIRIARIEVGFGASSSIVEFYVVSIEK